MDEDFPILKTNLRNTMYIGMCKVLFKIMGIFPFQIRISWLSKIYIALVMTFLISLHVCMVIYRNNENLTTFEDIFQTSSFLIPCIFYTHVLIYSFTKSNSWQTIYVDLRSFDRTYQKEQNPRRSKLISALKMAAMNLFIILYSIFYSYVFARKLPELMKRFHLPLPLHFTLFYEANVSVFIWEISYILQSRYRYLQKWLKKYVNSKQFIQVKRTNKDFQEIMRSYKLLYNVTKEINGIFGMLISYIIVHNITKFLANFYWYIVIHGTSQNWKYYLIQCHTAQVISMVSIYNTFLHILMPHDNTGRFFA